MFIARALIDSRAVFGRIDGDTFVQIDFEQAHPAHVDAITNLADALTAPEVARFPLADVELLAPVTPTKIVALAGTYLQDPKATFDPEKDRHPFFFFKPASAVVGTGQAIEIPEIARGAVFECELAAVVGKRCKGVSPEEALDYVFGYTICNDVSSPPVMQPDGQWSRGKGMDTFCPLGPVIATEIANPDDVMISADLVRAGETMQLVRQSTSTQVWNAATAIAYAAQYITLEPGDIVSLGCPPGPIPMEDGDEVRITLDGIGTLRNPVRFI